jgi:pimeloyl-ACP methyl ester carboxylesterase
VALDLSGHGDSGRREGYPRDIWAEEVMAVAEHAGIVGAPIVVGHSMGGFVTIATAARYGDRLAGAVILDSPVRRPNPEEEEGARGRAFRNPKVYNDVKTALEHFRLVPDQPHTNPFIIDHIARHSLCEVPGGVTWKFDPLVFRRVAPRAIHEVLPEVRCRVALFRAEFGLLTPDIGDYMYELLDRNAPVVEIPNAHHHLMLDQPLALVTGLRTILADWEHSVPRKGDAQAWRRPSGDSKTTSQAAATQPPATQKTGG